MRRITIILTILVATFLQAPLLLAAQSVDLSESRVLLINSYHTTFPTIPQIYHGLLAGFGKKPPVIDVEYMDSKRLYDETSVALFHDSLAYKLKHRPTYDLVVVADDNALDFIRRYGNELFPGTPVVFLGLNNQTLAAELANHRQPLITGVVEAVSIGETIKLIHQLRPDTQQLYLIADNTPTGQSDLHQAQSFQKTYPDLSFTVIDLSQLRWSQFSDTLRKISPNDSVLLLAAYRDAVNDSLSFEQSLQLIMNWLKAPVFHIYEHGMGEGITGGILVSLEEQGRQAGIKARKILEGTPVDAVPILTKSPNLPIFDSRQLEKFNIPLSLLPANADIRYQDKTDSFLQAYWREISVVTTIIVLLCLLIIVLAHQNRLRRLHSLTLEENELRLRTILDNIDAYIYMKDEQGHYLFANRALCSYLGLPPQDVISKTAEQLYEPEAAAKIIQADKKVFQTKRLYKKEEGFWTSKHRKSRDIQTTKIPLINQNDEVYGLCGISMDITDQKNHEKQLQHIAHHDQLTGLPNRILFSDRLNQAMKYADRNGSRITIMYFDLDGFKSINDLYGHHQGDYLLRHISLRVKNAIRNNDTVARLGGDEFIILLLNARHAEDDLEMTHKLLNAISEPVFYKGSTLSVTASFGITNYPQTNPIEADILLRQADQAMYIAKNSGRNRFHFFDAQIENNALKLEQTLNEVSLALERNEFRLFYQPKVNLLTGKVIGMEALIRWQHPEKGLLPPGAFLADIEQHNVMIDIDQWVVQESLRQLDEWRAQNIELPVSINVSHLYFKQQKLATKVSEQLNRYPDLDASLLELEIVESQALENLPKVAAKISKCQELGISFALDDFGTGYSSLTYLKQLPVNVLKVDSSFVIDMLDDSEDRMILEGILALSQAFNLKVIAEGMETDEHGRQLKEMGYCYAQGYGIAKPMPAYNVIDWLNHWKAPDEWQ
ncbi:hypothetical protein DI392_10900 [Vibrio albus]|uniref:EAL domain-containing protein n=1 Tax=Vibrio albus TaxID=2200953 RepID=A0A2U3B9D7_9VIBR|nr:ABC transporter substrate binding protein [Vibrio albus]PWI33355.1 hypothetical protein DI392_10900 [Vibrio albus]